MSRTTFGENEIEIENKDPFVVTPPRKHGPNNHTSSTTPATPKSKSTPLHKRFLEEVTMSPDAPSTLPHTPSRSPRRGQSPAKQMLEVGQNGFYFSMEIPEKKVIPRRAATPDTKTPGRLTPSSEKMGGMVRKTDTKGAGRVKDILRKNLFGTPTKKAFKLGRNDRDKKEAQAKGEVKTGAATEPSCISRAGDGSEAESAQGPAGNIAVKQPIAPVAIQQSSTAMQSSTELYSTKAPLTTQKSNMPSNQQRTPRTLSPTPIPATGTPAVSTSQQRSSAASTPSDIGHLMAGLSNKSSRYQSPRTVGGCEGMPTPLRKMSERLGLGISNVGRLEGTQNIVVTAKKEVLRLDVKDHVVSAMSRSPSEAHTTTALAPPKGMTAMPKETSFIQLLESPVVIPSRPSTATATSFPAPSTPIRPGPPSRSQSFGTPARLRFSIQEDMYKVQESLKRSLGRGLTSQTSDTRAPTPISPALVAISPIVPATDHSKSSPRKAARPVSMIGSPKTKEMAQAVPRRQLNTATCKPRPKSMIVGSARVLETVASQVDSPRERAKLRSAAATPSTVRSRPTTPRPTTSASTSRGPVVPPKKALPASRSQPTFSTTKSAAVRIAAHPKRAALSMSTTTNQAQEQKAGGPTAIANRVPTQNFLQRQKSTPNLTRTKSIKAPKPAAPKPKSASRRVTKTPEPKDPKADSGLGIGPSYTPPGNPTRLPSPIKSPSKTRLVVAPVAPRPTLQIRTVHPEPAPAPAPAPAVRTPFSAKTPVNRRARAGLDASDPNALRTPSKEIQSSLDRAIDAKIAEDRRRGMGGWL